MKTAANLFLLYLCFVQPALAFVLGGMAARGTLRVWWQGVLMRIASWDRPREPREEPAR